MNIIESYLLESKQINRLEVIKRVRNLIEKKDLTNVTLLAGTALVMHKVKDKTNDIDIKINNINLFKKYYSKLKNDPYMDIGNLDMYKLKDPIDKLIFESTKHSIIIDGIGVMSKDYIIKFYKAIMKVRDKKTDKDYLKLAYKIK
jgi:hypothetical protein|tara:strand:+ start:217 stop:651 length:435 start_codon:yes stop_codon:yes gene_type:complete